MRNGGEKKKACDMASVIEIEQETTTVNQVLVGIFTHTFFTPSEL